MNIKEQIIDLCQAIEQIPAHENQTRASIKASELSTAIGHSCDMLDSLSRNVTELVQRNEIQAERLGRFDACRIALANMVGVSASDLSGMHAMRDALGQFPDSENKTLGIGAIAALIGAATPK